MPADNIKRATQRGTGELPGVTYEEITYEAYGPAGIAILISCVTDNKNRLVSELRHTLERNGGKLAEAGSVAWAFHKKGILTVPKRHSEDEVLSTILDAGAEDMKTEDDAFEISAAPENFEAVRRALDQKGIAFETAELQMVPQNTLKVEGKDAEHVLKLMEVLEEHDDVQQVYSNFDIDEKVMASFHA
jgi:YebC/PmpR family DNA-binding regulatory protein